VGRIRDIVHVNDVVEAIYQSVFNEKSYYNVYNLGSGTTITVAQIIDKLYEQMGIGNPPEVLQEAADIGDPFKTHADISASQSDLNWNPKISPDEGITLTTSKYKLK
jgi:nucleoside-diphosphate-sugar epimerase